jgi:hypothetical protein
MSTAPNVVPHDQVLDLPWAEGFAMSDPGDRPLIIVDAHLLWGDRVGVDIVRDIVEGATA